MIFGCFLFPVSPNSIHDVYEKVAYLAPKAVVPGEMEMEALALGALRVLSGEEEAKEYL